FHLVGYGCTTCIGNSGPLPEAVSAAVAEGELVVCSVLSGNRNFEGRIQQEVRANYLASPPLVVAYALAGRIDLDLQTEALGTGKDGKPVYLRDIWPTAKEVNEMVRGTFANVRLKNLLAPGTEGPVTVHLPDGEQMTIYDASVKYLREGVPLIVIAGQEYGSGSSRDWAAKGPRLLGVRAVIAQSYERIHRSNLVGMGILPLQFLVDETAASLGLTGSESFDIAGLAGVLAEGFPRGKELELKATRPDGSGVRFKATIRIDTPQELQYYRHGGILEYV